MKCPILVVEDIRCHDNQLTDTSDCIKEECAWFEPEFNKCAVRHLNATLSLIELRLLEKNLTAF